MRTAFGEFLRHHGQEVAEKSIKIPNSTTLDYEQPVTLPFLKE